MVVKEVYQSISPDERASNPAQQLFDNTVDMASVLKQRVKLTVNSKGGARYDFLPIKATTIGPSNPTTTVTIFEASTKLPSSIEGTNGQKKPKKEEEIRVNEALKAKNKRREQNKAIFSGIDGKTVYQNGQPVNVRYGPNRENGTKNKTKSRGRRNGSR